MKQWMKQIAVFLAWLANVALAFWVMVVLHNALLAGLKTWYVGSSIPRSWRARAWNQGYFVVAGLVYLIFTFAIDGYLRDGLKKGDTFRRFAKTAAIELLIVFAGDLVTSLAQQSLFGPLSLLLLGLELLVGGGFLAYAIVNDPKRRKSLTRGENA